ncbi:oligosaccharide flippase family protein [Vibrio vulnificus]
MKIAKDILIYLSVEVVSKSIPFLLLPYLTRVLTPSDYAYITTFTAISSLFSIIIGFNSQNAISALFYKNHDEIGLYISSSLRLWIGSSIFCILFVSILFFLSDNYLYIIIFPCLFSIFWFPFSLCVTIFRLENSIKFYAIFVITEVAFNVILTSALVPLYGAKGRVLSLILSMLIFFFISVFIIIRNYNVKINVINIISFSTFYSFTEKDFRILKICTPVLPHLVTGWIRSGLDRYIVSYFFGMMLLGMYGVAGQLAMVIGVFSNAVTLAIGPFVQRKLSGGYSKQKLVILTYLTSISLIFISILYIAFCDYFGEYILGEQYHDSLNILPYFVFSLCFQGISNLFIVYVYYSENTKLLFKFAFPCGIVFIAIQIICAKYFSFDVFKWLLVWQSIIYLALVFYISNKSFKMPWTKFI